LLWLQVCNFAAEWGTIAFALNCIPFIGPFIATLFPTLASMTQFDTWQAVVGIFVCLNIIQFVIGSSAFTGISRQPHVGRDPQDRRWVLEGC
jgi:predicted PurR-regulated permease PerM